MKTRTMAMALAGLVLATGTIMAGPFQYSAVNIGGFGGSGGTDGVAINSNGEVVGGSYAPNGNEYAFSYLDGTLTNLGTLGGSSSMAYGINASGEIVGGAYTPNGNEDAFSYKNGSMTGLNIGGLLGFTNAWGINNAGTIAGSGYVKPFTYSQPFDTFVYSNGSSTIVSTPGGTTGADAINNSGTVVGGYALNSSNFFFDAFSYSNGNFQDLGTFGGAWVTYAMAINDSGTIVGAYSNPGTNRGGNAFSFRNGTYTALGALPGGGVTAANAINDPGVIVGYSGGDAFVYTNGAMSNLNSDLANTLPTTLINATAINDSGQIVAIGANGSTYLLTPNSAATPEPSSIWLVGTAGLGIFFLRRH